jgi:hypothetical protein
VCVYALHFSASSSRSWLIGQTHSSSYIFSSSYLPNKQTSYNMGISKERYTGYSIAPYTQTNVSPTNI